MVSLPRRRSHGAVGAIAVALVGGFLGYMAGAFLACSVFMAGSCLCGSIGLITGLLGLIGGGITGPAIARKLSTANFHLFMGETMAGWEGSDANDLIAPWGPPKRVMDDGERGKIFIYIFDRASNTPAEIVTREFDNWFDGKRVRTTYRPSEAAESLAFRIFWINPQNRVYRWAWRGE